MSTDLNDHVEAQKTDRPRRMRIPRSRRLTIDLLHYRAKVPTCAHDRICDFRSVAEARQRCPARISWSMIFIKAFGLVAARYPVLRQMYLPWPWPHIYQHPTSVAMVATHRDFLGEPWLFWSRFNRPEGRSLLYLQSALDRYQTASVEEVFPWQFQLSGLPTPVRRLLWSWTFHVGGPARARRAGTFFLTTIAGQGAEIQHPPAFLTSNVTYGPIDENGKSRVTIAYDHRLMDGRLVASALAEIDAALSGPIVAELDSISSDQAPTVPLKRTA
jgi:hypothetical protein